MVRPSVTKPNCCPSRWRKLLVSSAAPTRRTTERATCATIRDFWSVDDFSALPRPEPRRASAGLDREAIQAGAIPNTTPVSRDKPRANKRTDTDGFVLIGKKLE